MALCVICLGAHGNETKVAAASYKYFAYRIDCYDSNYQWANEKLAIDVSANFNGTVYAFANRPNEKSLSASDIKSNGVATSIRAGKETTAYCKVRFTENEKYNIYICCEAKGGKLYGPFVKKNWVGTYFPAGNGSKSKPYQIWNYRHLYNLKLF